MTKIKHFLTLLLVIIACMALASTLIVSAQQQKLCRDTLDPSKINDDYCDCESDGSDETETSACSHIHILTPNVSAEKQSNRFHCKNQGYVESFIHPSKVNDAICDCCDGSDEPKGRCPSNCRDLGKDMRREIKTKIDIVKTGLKIKKDRSAQAKVEFDAKKKELEQLKSQLEEKTTEKNKAEAEKERLEKIEEVEKNLLKQKKELEKAQQQPKEVKEEAEQQATEEQQDANNADEDSEWMSFKTEEADKARETVQQLEKDTDSLSSQISKIESLFNIDFGSENEYYPIYERCFSMKQRQYTYEACMYGKANQKEHGSTYLGTFSGWNEDKTTMKFQHGTRCWQGPDRSCDVKMECGSTEEIVSVDEPSRCVYEMVMKTPSACTEAMLESLQAQLKQLE